MRALEFLPEAHGGVMGKRRRSATRGLNTFQDTDRWQSGWNTDYTTLRVMMAAASTDGKTPPNIDGQSWVGKSASAHPYTQEEQDMLKLAYQAAGAKYRDLNHGDMDSEEMNTVNKTSPIKSFGGYPR
jgi:hypothetical protein